MEKSKKRQLLQKLCIAAMLLALRIVLERFLSVNLLTQRFGFSFVALSLSAVLLGTPWTVAVAGLGDVLGAILFPQGPYFPGFTLTACLIGLSTGYFLGKRPTVPRIVLCVFLNNLIGSILLNSYWLTLVYHLPYWASLPKRVFQAIFMIVLQLLVNILLFSEKSRVRGQLRRLRPEASVSDPDGFED